MVQEPDNLHPILSTMSIALQLRNMVLLPLVALNEKHERQCWLCVSLPKAKSKAVRFIKIKGKSKLLVSWDIRSDAKWGDGTPVTGADMRLAWQIGTASTVANATPESFNGIEDVILDSTQPKRFTLQYKKARFDALDIDVSFIPLPSHIEGPIFERTRGIQGAYEKATAYITSPDLPGLYNGPFRVQEISGGSHIMLESNPLSHPKPMAIKTVIFKLVPNPSALIAHLESGSIDMTAPVGGLTADQGLEMEARLRSTPNLAKRLKVVWFDNLALEKVDFNLDSTIMSDLAVRQALSLATDREALCKGLFNGRFRPTLQPFHAVSPYFQVNLGGFNTGKSGKEAAERRLEESGWKLGPDGVRAKNGKKLSLTMMSMSQNRQREAVELFLQKAWANIGVRLAIQNQPARVFYGETLRKRGYGDMALYANALTAPEDLLYSQFHSNAIASAANSWSGSNNPGWRNAKVDAALDKALGMIDLDERQKQLKTVSQEFMQEQPSLPLFMSSTVALVPLYFHAGLEAGLDDFPFTLKADKWRK